MRPFRIRVGGVDYLPADYVLDEIQKRSPSLGREAYLRSREHQKTREIWIASVVLVGIQQLTGFMYYIRPISEKEQVPDAEALRVVDIENGESEYFPIEIVEVHGAIHDSDWDSTLPDEDNIANLIIDRKFRNRTYPNGTNIFILIRTDLKELPLDSLAERIKPNVPSWCGGVWTLGLTSLEKDSHEYFVTMLYPEVISTSLQCGIR